MQNTSDEIHIDSSYFTKAFVGIDEDVAKLQNALNGRRKLFNEICDKAAEVAQQFGYGVRRTSDMCRIWISSNHLVHNVNLNDDKILPNNTEYAASFNLLLDMFIVRRNVVLQLPDGHMFMLSNEFVGPLKDFDINYFEQCLVQLHNEIIKQEKRIEYEEQQKMIKSITDSASMLETGDGNVDERLIHFR